jgi:hypothetical protein
MQVTNNLFQNLNCPAYTFYSGFSLTADSVHFETEFGFQLPDTQDLHPVRLSDQSVNVKILRGKLGDTIFFGQRVELTQVEDFVLDPMDVVEPTFGNTALDRHLTTFVGIFALITGPALSTLVTFGRSAAFTGSFTAAEPLLFMRCAFCRLDRV